MIHAAEDMPRGQTFPLRRFEHDAMACTFALALVCEDADYAEQAARAAFAEIDRLERELSRFIPTSDIARINTLATGAKLRIGIEAVECLQLATQIRTDTNGAFDVTYGSKPLTAGPRTGRDDRLETGPTASCPTAQLELDPKGRYVRVHAKGVRVDLGGIGKGYAIDQVLEILRDWSIDAGLIHSGQSSVFALGAPPGSEHWTIALRDPVDHDRTLGHVSLKNAALSGSARKLHGDHIIDPRRGVPVDDKLGTWALAPSAAQADALSTAFMVMSPTEVAAYCRQHSEISALLVLEAAGTRRLLQYGPGFALDER